MLDSIDQELIVTTFSYSQHWILAMIVPKISWVVIMDPLDVNESSYKEFLNAIQGYVREYSLLCIKLQVLLVMNIAFIQWIQVLCL